MKCGSCRSTNADSYKKITEGDSIFEVLKNLNPRRAYNAKYSYFCGLCTQLAVNKQSQIMSTISNQNANSFTNLNTSTSTQASDSSKDEYDLIVMPKYVFSDTGTPIPIPNRSRTRNESKRPAEDAQRPCPKRFKKPFTPILEENLPAVQEPSSQHKSSELTQRNRSESSERNKSESSQRNRSESSQQKSSESIPENEMLLNVEHDTSPISSRSSPIVERQSPGVSRSVRTTPFLEKSGTSAVKEASSQEKTPESSQTNRSELSQQKSSESSIPENEMLMNVEQDTSSPSSRSPPSLESKSPGVSRSARTQPFLKRKYPGESPSPSQSPLLDQQTKERTPSASRVQHDSVSLSSEVARNQPVVVTKVASIRDTAKNKPQSIIKSRPKTLLQYDSDSSDVSISSNRQTTVPPNNQIRQIQQDSTVQNTVQASLAPAVKNPRIRQDSANIPKDIRSYFSTQNFNVNNYSRSLAG